MNTGAAPVALGYHAHTSFRQGPFVFGDRSTTDPIRAAVDHSAYRSVSNGFRIFTSSSLNTNGTWTLEALVQAQAARQRRRRPIC